MMACELVVFDVDGTLVDSADIIVHCMKKAFLSVERISPADDKIRGIIGLSLDEAICRIAPELPPQHLGKIVAEYKRLFLLDRTRNPAPLFPGARECLSRLSAAGYRLGVATGKSRKGLDATFAHHRLAEAFVAVGCADDGPGKPHPFMIEKVIAEAGADPASTAMVGDTVFDIEMARAAGVRAVGVAWGNHSAQALAAAGADVVAKSFAELEDWLRSALPIAADAAIIPPI
jgi:phosphoglycolate phosphatase